MIEDNKPLENLSLAELKEQRIYAIRNLASWREKLSACRQPDAKVVCRNEVNYWRQRIDDIHTAMYSHPDR